MVRIIGGNDAVDADTVFPIASITKSFTATAMAMLVDEGKVAWMDCVTKHLPEFQLKDPWLGREVRIADFLSQRTGLEDPDHSSGEFDRAELIRRARFLPQIAPFRSGYYYNNTGLIIAGEVIERVAGRSWAEVVRDRILRPLEMSSTLPDVRELKAVKNVATSYVSVNGELQKDKSWNLPLSEGWSRYREAIRPAGAICSTVNDMAKFAIFHLNLGEFHGRRLLKADTVREMQVLHSTLPLIVRPKPELTYPKIAVGSGFGWASGNLRNGLHSASMTLRTSSRVIPSCAGPMPTCGITSNSGIRSSPPDEGKLVIDQTARLSVDMSKTLPTWSSRQIEPELDWGH